MRPAPVTMAKVFGVVGVCAAVLQLTIASAMSVPLLDLAVMVSAMCGAGFLLGKVASLHHAVLIAIIFGWIMGSGTAPIWRAEVGLAWAALAFVVLVPAAIVGLTLAGRRIGKARSRSPLDRLARRRLAATGALVVSALASATIVCRTTFLFVPLAIGSLSLLALVVVGGLDGRALLRALRARPDAANVLDFGEGEFREERRDEVPASYRTTPIVVTVKHGSRARALRAIAVALAFDALAISLACAAFTSALTKR